MSDESTQSEQPGQSTKVNVDVTNPASAPPAEPPADAKPESGNDAPSHGNVAAGHPTEGGNTGIADKE